MRRLVCFLMLLLIGSGACGCRHAVRTGKISTVWADFNLYERPALFHDVKSHYPSPVQDTMYFNWLHGPNSSAPYRRMGTQYPGLAAAAAAEQGAEQGPPRYEQMPPPGAAAPPVQIEVPGELLPPLAAPPRPVPPRPLPPPPAETGLPGEGMQPWPRDQRPELQTPVPEGPTAQHPGSWQKSSIQPAGWQTARPALPGSNTVFARP